MQVLGLDVSHHQGQVKWPVVAGTGVAFAYAKATEGSAFQDPEFATNWQGIRDAGLRRGAYHFFRPEQPVAAQIDQFVTSVGLLETDDLAPMLDIEEVHADSGHDEWDAIPLDERVPMILAALDATESTLGLRPVLYVRRGFVSAKLPNPEPLGAYPLWVAHYTDAAEPITPSVWARWTFWQYSEKGKVRGIKGRVDLDRFNGSFEQLELIGRT
jgi:lysozyme